jgi:hypothetical protein
VSVRLERLALMGLSLWALLTCGLLLLNAFAILHPQRFLRRCASLAEQHT